MKKALTFVLLTMFFFSGVSAPTIAADGQLIPVGNLPTSLIGDMGAAAKFTFDLPASAPVNSAENAQIDVYYIYKIGRAHV